MAEQGTKSVSSTRTQMSEIVTPNHANFLGKAFGGAILSMIDLCAYTTASRFAGMLCVTASFDRVDFHEPIEVGALLTLVGTVTYVGRTSLEVTIEVYAEDIYKGEERHTNTARVTMVALRDGKPTEVPRILPQTREEKIGFLQGRARREFRSRQREELDRLLSTFDSASDEQLDALLKSEKLV